MDPVPTSTVGIESTVSVPRGGRHVAALLERALVVLDGAEWCLPDDAREARVRIAEATQVIEQALDRVRADQPQAAVAGLPLSVVLEQLSAAAQRFGQPAAIEVPDSDEGPPRLGVSVAPAEAATVLRVATRALREAGPRLPGHDRPIIEVRVGHDRLELTARSRRPGAGWDACTQYLRVGLAPADATAPAGEEPTGSRRRVVDTGVDSPTGPQLEGRGVLRTTSPREAGTAAR